MKKNLGIKKKNYRERLQFDMKDINLKNGWIKFFPSIHTQGHLLFDHDNYFIQQRRQQVMK